MKPLCITYRFRLPDNDTEVVALELDSTTLQLSADQVAALPEWAVLDYCQCPHCPLAPQLMQYCPACAALAGIVNRFDSLISYDTIYLSVETEERTISQKTTAQRAISSLIGLVMAGSGCPHTEFFKPMARFHLPLSTEEETLYRACSMYLLAQYFIRKQGKKPDLELDGLKNIYDNIQLLNLSIIQRLREASKTDSSINALIVLDTYAKAMPFVIEESLGELRYLFTPYF